jgi:hypothetical protein
MRTIPADDIHTLAGPTILCSCCLAVLLASHIFIGVGLARILSVELPSAMRSHLVQQ